MRSLSTGPSTVNSRVGVTDAGSSPAGQYEGDREDEGEEGDVRPARRAEPRAQPPTVARCGTSGGAGTARPPPARWRPAKRETRRAPPPPPQPPRGGARRTPEAPPHRLGYGARGEPRPGG